MTTKIEQYCIDVQSLLAQDRNDPSLNEQDDPTNAGLTGSFKFGVQGSSDLNHPNPYIFYIPGDGLLMDSEYCKGDVRYDDHQDLTIRCFDSTYESASILKNEVINALTRVGGTTRRDEGEMSYTYMNFANNNTTNVNNEAFEINITVISPVVDSQTDTTITTILTASVLGVSASSDINDPNAAEPLKEFVITVDDL